MMKLEAFNGVFEQGSQAFSPCTVLKKGRYEEICDIATNYKMEVILVTLTKAQTTGYHLNITVIRY